MRLVLPAIALGAVGIGYVYSHQSALPAAESRSAASRPLFDWQSADDTLKVASSDIVANLDEPPLVVRDTISSVRTEITSVLDEFVRVNGEPNSAGSPSDIISQATATESPTTDQGLIPFASSDDRQDVTSSTGTPDSTRLEPVKEAAKATKPAPAKPAINEATLVTKKPTTKTEPARTQSARTPQDSDEPTTPKTKLLPGKLPARSDIVDSDWKIIGKTSGGLPMHSRRFGRQGTRTLVIAGLDGKDLIGTRWNDDLAEALLHRGELLQTNEVLVVRAGNPDGLVKKASPNSHGVLINRNFPSRRYQFLTDNSAGPGPASEAETHAIMEAFYSFRPRRVISLSAITGRSTVLYNRAASRVAEELQKQFRLNVQPLDVELLPGSVEDFADGTLDAAVISMQLDSGNNWQQSWEKHLPAVLTAIHGQSLDQLNVVLADDLTRSSPEVEGTPIPKEPEEPTPSGKRNRGYEELPPPPR